MAPGLTFNIYGNDVSGSSSLRRFEGEADRSTQTVGGKFKSMGAAIGKGLAALGAVDFLKGSFDEAEEAQKVGAQTAAVIKSTGSAAHVSAGQMSDLAGSVSQKVGIDDEAIQSGQNMLLTFTDVRNEVGKGNDIFNQATSIMTDMSVATGTSMTGAATMLGKALNDPVAGVSKLTKVGVTFTEAQKEQIKTLGAAGDKMGAQKIILGELSKEFGGSAAAQATSADKMEVAFGNLQEQVGTALMPIITTLADFLTDDVMPAVSGVTGFLQSNWSWIKYVAGAAGAMWLAYRGYTILSSVGPAVTGLTRSVLGQVGVLRSNASALRANVGAAGASGRAWGGAAVGFAAAGVAIYALGKGISDAIEGDRVTHHLGDWTQNVNSFRDALLASNGALNDSIRLEVQKKLQDSGLADRAKAAGISLTELTTAVTGNGEAYKDLVAKWKASGDPAKDTTFALYLLHTQYATGATQAKGLAAATKESNATQKDAKPPIDAAAEAMKKQKEASDKLLASIKALSGDKIDAAQAELRFKDGLAQASTQVKENGRSLSENTVKGRSNREWLLSQLSSLKDVASAQLDAGQSTEVVTGKLGTNKAALEKAAIAAGLSKSQVRALIDEFGQMPVKKEVPVSAPGATAAANQVEEVGRQARLLPGGKSVPVSAPGASQAALDVQALRTNLSKLPSSVGVSVNAQGQIGVKGGGRYAQGTGFTRGGRTLVGEFGPELLTLPRGAQVDTADTTLSRQRMAGGGGGNTYVLQFPGTLMDEQSVRRAVRTALESDLNSGGRIVVPAGSIVSR